MNTTTDERDLVRSESYQRLNKIQGRLALYLLISLIALVILFDILSVFMPGLMGQTLGAGTVYSVGVIFAFIIILAIVAVAVFYVWLLNRAHAELERHRKS